MRRFLLWTLPVCAQVRADDYYLELNPMRRWKNEGMTNQYLAALASLRICHPACRTGRGVAGFHDGALCLRAVVRLLRLRESRGGG